MSGEPVARRAAVIVFPGSNGDRDLAEALSAASFAVQLCRSDEPLPAEAALIGLPGGFSYGDYWRAGMLASRARAVRELPQHVARGGLVIGVCNGFQILVEAGLLPGALGYNAPPGFRHRWVEVEVGASAVGGPWFNRLRAGARLRLPMAHAEGRYQPPADAAEPGAQIPLRYCENPNGSYADAAALLDRSGRVLGIMPHPERAADPRLGSSDGMALFASAACYLHATFGGSP
ncbi:MAG TPA: phosphoribosylformylglycinamidine synthase subunit PurQ [Pseudomonadota bacterium]|nr:phosphoribosylformylglycinamidine synthase subunit PurQ [Pseudomonadota bacterium]